MTTTVNRFLIKSPVVVLVLLISSASVLQAQVSGSANQQSMNENSPYNRYGIGLTEEIASGVIRAIGGGGNAFSDEVSTNTFNPASYSYMLATTLDGGFAGKQRSVSFNGKTSVNSFTGTLSYLNLVVPIKKMGGLALGFQPISNTYYRAADTGNIAGDPVSRTFNGRGGLNQFFVGLAGKYKDLSLGVNVNYTFGSIDHNNYLTSYGLSSVRSYTFTELSRYAGWNWKAGLMYKIKLGKESYLNVGATYQPSYKLKGNRDRLGVAANEILNSDGRLYTINVDTVISGFEEAGSLVMPASYGFGVQYSSNNKIDVLADFQYSDWSKYAAYGLTDSIAKNAMRTSVGVSYTPNANALYTSNKGSYFSAVTYRFGMYYGQDYLSLRGTQLNDVGGTFGFSFPLKRSTGTNQVGKIHTSFMIGQRGTLDHGLAKENYVRFTISASLNDIWFIKPKYD